ncbi:MAG TPA: hypothetical protein VLG09_05615 [Candidatus Saccharimonadales bacterium]|nr:hypothetical protein [Candidatus Saccharimonadales bacterium]
MNGTNVTPVSALQQAIMIIYNNGDFFINLLFVNVTEGKRST